MAIRCYYWNDKKVSLRSYYYSKLRGRYTGMQLKYGNAGDIINKDLLKFLYNEDDINIAKEGNRLLLVGSILNVVEPNDVIAGIGWKGNVKHPKVDILNTCEIYGLRGPLTYDTLKKSGVNVKSVKFLLDPGLLINEIYQLKNEHYTPKGVIFIPHYREYGQYLKKKLPLGIRLEKIDNHPKNLATKILNSEFIVTSSLHVIIFCHALNRPCRFVLPQSEEPLFKYKDYFASVNINYQQPLDYIDNIKSKDLMASPIYVKKTLADFHFPEKQHLEKSKILI